MTIHSRLGRINESMNYPLPCVQSFTRDFRVIEADDEAVIVPANDFAPLDLTASRWGVDNTLVVLVKSEAAGVKIALFISDNGTDYWIAEQTTTKPNQVLIFTGLPALPLGHQVTGVTAPVTLSLGGTL